ncbi:mechanosensitive ion channel family protein [Haliangium ochraceum]|uniref:MscS Mechanosensitive ion channel n=1 Tax=Haliangium ochraceum (strain DSM 14365 / JCM 11303 / SMP-2) TaxID=502025 RepID=D0LJV4_HALO1|nr:mechanosensitive ion channel family protein [Haliangium ochraceum]ACY18461.1 MscS Mechanosensitive ion channel [Haliangium ochraceum DSM 14365]
MQTPPVEAVDTAEQVRGAWDRFGDRVDAFIDHLPIFGIAVGVVIAFLLLASLLRRWDAPFRLLFDSSLVRTVARNVTASLTIVIGLLLALELLDATALVGTVLGAAGVVGLALGFAFRDLVENYLASILLAVRRPFRAGDLVLIDDYEGKVMSLTTRATILMTLEGNHLRLPNATVFKAVITNYSRNPLRRLDFAVGAGTDENLAAAQRLGVSTLLDTPGVSRDPEPFSLIEELGDSSVSVRFLAWVDQREADFLRVRSEAIRRVKVAFDRAEIEMPEPIYRVMLTDRSAVAAEERPSKPREELEDAVHDVRVDEPIDRQMSESPDLGDGDNLLVDD